MASFAENRRARFDYDVLETFEAGVELRGYEVKSVKSGHMQLPGSYCLIRGGELWLVNAKIPAHQPKNAPEGYDPARTRKLLLKKNELKTLSGRLEEKGLTLVPLKAYPKKGLVKLGLGLGRSRKQKDKRDLLKKRAVERDVQREL